MTYFFSVMTYTAASVNCYHCYPAVTVPTIYHYQTTTTINDIDKNGS